MVRDWEAWCAAVHGVTKSWTGLGNWTTTMIYIYSHTHTHTHTYSHLLYLSICWWTLSLHPCLGYCKQCCYEHWGACIVQVKCLWALTDPIDILLCSNWTKILGISLNDVSVWNALPSMSPVHLPWLPLCLCVCVSVCDSPLWFHLVPHSLLVHSIDAYCIPGTVWSLGDTAVKQWQLILHSTRLVLFWSNVHTGTPEKSLATH